MEAETMRFRRRLGVLFGMWLLAGVLVGCGKGNTGSEGADAGTEQVKGRYVETEVALPQQLEGWTIQQLFLTGEKVHLLAARQEEGGTVLQEWEQSSEGFVEVTREWMKTLTLPCSKEGPQMRLLLPGGGEACLYADYVTEGEETYKAHLWTGENDAAKEITPEKWNVLNEEWGGYEMHTGIAALENGTLVAASYTSIDILDGRDGSVTESSVISAPYGDVLSDGENIWLYAAFPESDSGLILEKRRAGKTEEASTVSFPQGNGSMQICPMKDGTLFLAGKEGIFRAEEGTGGKEGTEWKKILAGAETDFSLADRWCIGLAARKDGIIYALFQKSGGGFILRQYAYDPEAVIEITEELKLYTVYESNLLTQAAAMYHREHPEVMITIEYAYPKYYDDETDYNGIYQRLNTMLMGEDAPDILVMDHLDLDSYAEKGLLEDLNDVAEPMEERGELLSNITSAWLQEDGHRYVIPLEFSFYMALGRDITAGDMASLEALASFLSKADCSYMGPLTTSELVERFYPYFCGEIVNGKQLNREVLGHCLEELKIIGDNCGILDVRDPKERAYNMWRLASEAKLAFTEAEGFTNVMVPLAIMDYIQGDFAAFENCFIPMVQTGICSRSAYKERAKEFLNYLLSESIQMTDFYGGFPVNAAAFEKIAHRDRSEAEAETSIMVEGGGEAEFQISDYNTEMVDQLTAVCRGLERPVGEDEKICEVLTEVMEGYLKGNQSLEDTVQKAEDGLKMYLAE